MSLKTNFRTILLFSVIILTLALLFGCAAKKPFWGNEKTGFIFNYNLPKDHVIAYEATTHQISTQEVMGQTMETTTDITANYSIQGVALDSYKNITSTVKMNKIDLVSKTMRGDTKPDLSAIVGKNFGFTFSPKGKKISFSDPESIKVDFGPMGGKRDAGSFFKNLFPRLPDNPIKIGSSWTVTEEKTEPQGGLDINIKSEAVNTLAGFETVDGMTCLKIMTKTTGTLDGKGKQGGMDVDFEGDLESASTWYYAYKQGTFVKSASETLVEGTAVVTGAQNITVPVTQEVKTEVKLIK